MPSLNPLEIKIHSVAYDVSVWQTLLQTSLRSLTYFTLEINAFGVKDVNVFNILESIQTPFWTERQNFNIIIKQFAGLVTDWFITDDLQTAYQYPSNKVVAH
jgi:hypothetical protein